MITELVALFESVIKEWIQYFSNGAGGDFCKGVCVWGGGGGGRGGGLFII